MPILPQPLKVYASSWGQDSYDPHTRITIPMIEINQLENSCASELDLAESL